MIFINACFWRCRSGEVLCPIGKAGGTGPFVRSVEMAAHPYHRRQWRCTRNPDKLWHVQFGPQAVGTEQQSNGCKLFDLPLCEEIATVYVPIRVKGAYLL